MMPSIWQWSGSGTPFAETVPAGLNCTDVICVGVTGKLVRFARLRHAPAGSDEAVAAKLAGAPKAAIDAAIKTLRGIVNSRCRGCRCGFMSFLPTICQRYSDDGR